VQIRQVPTHFTEDQSKCDPGSLLSAQTTKLQTLAITGDGPVNAITNDNRQPQRDRIHRFPPSPLRNIWRRFLTENEHFVRLFR